MAETISQLKEYAEEEFVCVGGKRGTLGAGGFGVVQLASHRVLGNVALKCFPVTGGDNEKERVAQEIKNELEMLQKANHDHILRVHGWTQWSGSMALVLEYMPGGNLGRLLRDPRIKLSPVLRLRVCFEIAKALAFIHNLMEKKRLTHGDVKPANVLLTEDLHCKLGDFGSAKVAKRTGFTSATGSGPVSNELTLAYAAPERLAGPTKPRKAHDTYSFGVIIHTVLSGHAPHEYYANGKQYIEAVKKGGRPQRSKIEEMKQSLTSDRDKMIIKTLESVMERCWDQNPSRRPEMLKIRDELEDLLSETSHFETMISVATAVSMIEIFIPVKSSMSVPLKMFDTRKKVFKTGTTKTKDGHDDVEQSPKASTFQVPQQKTNQQIKNEDGPANVQMATLSSQGEVKELLKSRPEDVQIAAVALTARSAPQQKGKQCDPDIKATISESAMFPTQGKGNRSFGSLEDNVKMATMALTSQIPPYKTDEHCESEVEATISQSTILLTKDPSPLFKYKVLHNFAAQQSDELSLTVGDIITVDNSRHGDPGWLSGEKDGKSGWVPDNFVEKIKSGEKVNQQPSSHQEDIEMATMALTSRIPPHETDMHRESEIEATITQENVNEHHSSHRDDIDIATMALTTHVPTQKIDKDCRFEENMNQLHSAHHDDLEMAAMTMTSQIPPQETNMHSEPDVEATITQNTTSLTKENMNQLHSAHHDDLEMATMTMTSQIPPQETNMHSEPDVEATITQNTTSLTKENMNQLHSAHHDDLEMATMTITSQIPPQETNMHSEPDVEATITQNTTSLTKENMNQLHSAHHDDLEMATMTMTSQIPPQETNMHSEPDVEATITQNTTSLTKENMNQLHSAHHDDLEMATMTMTSQIPPQETNMHSEPDVEATITQNTTSLTKENMNQLHSAHHDDLEMATMTMTSQIFLQQANKPRETEVLATISQNTMTSTQKNLQLFKYRAMHNFTARNSDELSFLVGDIIVVDESKHGDQGWLSGEKDGKSGWIPDNFVEKIKSKESITLFKYRALHNFSARNAYELSMVVGDIVTVNESKHGAPGWLSGEKDGKSGWVQAQMVEKIKPRDPANLFIYRALCNFDARNTDELSIVVGDNITVDESKHVAPGWLSGEKDGKSGWVQAHMVEKIKRKKRVAPRPPINRKPTMDEVFGSKGQSVLPGNTRQAPDLLKQYKNHLKNRSYVEALAIRTNLMPVIENSINATAEDVRVFGDKLVEEKRFLEAIAIFDVAAALFAKMNYPEDDLARMTLCIQTMMNVSNAMIGDDVNTKGIVKEHVISVMRDWLRHMQHTFKVSVQSRCLQVSYVLAYIAHSEHLVDHFEEQEQALRIAITGMRRVFRSNVIKQHGSLFGSLLNNLGFVCKRTSRFEEAASLFKQATDAFKTATDVGDEEERKGHIARCEKNVIDAQRRIKC